MTKVLVANEDIVAGKPITAEMVTEKEIPKKYMLDSLIQSKDDLKGKISMVPIANGAVITSSVLRNNTIVTGQNRQVMLRAPLAVFDEQIDALDKVDIVVSYDAQPGPGEPTQQDKRTTKVLFKDVTVNQVFKKGDAITAIGVVLSLEDSKNAIWALNYGKEVRVLKSGSAKAQSDANKTQGTNTRGASQPQKQPTKAQTSTQQ
jgi:pilus assembly protein CpaB